MDSQSQQAVEVLLDLGLKEYEAKCFVVLSRMPKATAKEISESTDVPRTRVYDAVRVLEAKGLVEVQHSSPQQFRAVPIDEALTTLQDLYESRMMSLRDSLQGLEPVEVDDEEIQEVWSMADSKAIKNRTASLIDRATDEIVIVIGEDALLTDDLLEQLAEPSDRVDVMIGALTESAQERIRNAVPDAEVFVTGLEWLHGDDTDETAIGRLLLVDRGTILVSSWEPDTGKERAIFGRGFGNGLVVIARRLMATGLLSDRNSGTE